MERMRYLIRSIRCEMVIWTYGWVGLSTDAGTTTTVHWVSDLLQVKLGSGLEVRLGGLVPGALSSSAGAFFPRGGYSVRECQAGTTFQHGKAQYCSTSNAHWHSSLGTVNSSVVSWLRRWVYRTTAQSSEKE